MFRGSVRTPLKDPLFPLMELASCLVRVSLTGSRLRLPISLPFLVSRQLQIFNYRPRATRES